MSYVTPPFACRLSWVLIQRPSGIVGLFAHSRDEKMAGLEYEPGELGFEPKLVGFRWHSSRIACTSQAIETRKIKGKPRFNRILRISWSHGQYCPQFVPIWALLSSCMKLTSLYLWRSKTTFSSKAPFSRTSGQFRSSGRNRQSRAAIVLGLQHFPMALECFYVN
jgi:hypothetical protein